MQCFLCHLPLTGRMVWNLNTNLSVFCDNEYWQDFPEQPSGNQTKDPIKLPNLHWVWKF